jgi:hypothetical protein
MPGTHARMRWVVIFRKKSKTVIHHSNIAIVGVSQFLSIAKIVG